LKERRVRVSIRTRLSLSLSLSLSLCLSLAVGLGDSEEGEGGPAGGVVVVAAVDSDGVDEALEGGIDVAAARASIDSR
jgi:hypothetical protein